MSSTVLDKFKRKWYNKNVEPISLTPVAGSNTTNNSNTTTGSTNANSNAGTNNNTSTERNQSNSTAVSLFNKFHPQIYTAICTSIIVFGILGIISVLFCPTCQPQVQPSPQSIPDEFDDSDVIPPVQVEPNQISPFMSICLLGYTASILLSIIIFGIEFIRKHGWKKYSYIMFDEDGQYLFISILFLLSGKSAVFVLLLILSAIVRLLPNLAIITNNHPKIIEIQQKIYSYDLGDKFARFELFLLFNEVLSFSILRMIVVINFICHRYLVFAQLRNYIMTINHVIDQYVPGMLRNVYTKACYYLNQYVTSLSQRKLQVEQGQ
ncbi:predicted protein [Naegleria gruberi]|uniref:Predicted protein n=1 Tax=Naegleria gruberi TaxID=5762 RepID=D2VYA6_NAEGR|nr:uncharacterized protein NAEGRDRAFT_74050 [Naegleria gruberi]EFC38167.1 predicted protein [Naegleria gruberi]|eukprot:XP_002670911.1 predicted protein [Naegleria gruberi strain NEG-M]